MKTGALSMVLALSLVTHARADVAPPPPEELACSPGAIGAVATIPSDALDERGRPARPWPYCRPTTCTSDAECTGGRVCSTEEVGLCVRDRVDFGVTSREAIERGCEQNGTCLNLQSTCERARRCVPAPAVAPPASPPPMTTTSTGLCQASPGTRNALVPWLLGALGLVLFRARRPNVRRHRDRDRRFPRR